MEHPLSSPSFVPQSPFKLILNIINLLSPHRTWFVCLTAKVDNLISFRSRLRFQWRQLLPFTIIFCQLIIWRTVPIVSNLIVMRRDLFIERRNSQFIVPMGRRLWLPFFFHCRQLTFRVECKFMEIDKVQ